MRWQLSGDGRSIVERATGAILNDRFYFMANTGIENLDDNGRIIDPAMLEPLRIAVVPLQ